MAAMLVQMVISRTLEYQADKGSAPNCPVTRSRLPTRLPNSKEARSGHTDGRGTCHGPHVYRQPVIGEGYGLTLLDPSPGGEEDSGLAGYGNRLPRRVLKCVAPDNYDPVPQMDGGLMPFMRAYTHACPR